MTRWRSTLALALSGSSIVAGCADEPVIADCTTEACVGEIAAPSFVDDAGQAVTTRGEFRAMYPNGLNSVSDFDCVPSGPPLPADGCRNGSSAPLRISIDPQSVVEVRFARRDGGWTDWQAVELALTERTDPNFGGPGCECTWYEAPAPTLVVPADARW
ncbi:MAG TPA: hypothetical protein VMG12_20495 [Polyangiaceae bacterium]|nr:hypothetical protein [Polyangiaceae bacterium]